MIRRHIRFSSTIRQRNSVKNWKDKLTGEPAFILGNGPSINDVDLTILSPFFTVGINRIFYAFDPTVLFWQDIELWYSDRKKILETNAIKVCRDGADPQNRFFHYKLEGNGYRIPEHLNILFGRGSTGPLAVQFAYMLGCDPIILVGCDCKSRGHATDFYGRNRHHLPHTMANCRKGLQWIKDFITPHRQVISCSNNDIFPTVPLNEVIQGFPSERRKQRNHWSTLLL
jgi:hypothetical protein